MFTAVIVDNDFGDFMETKRAINLADPRVSIDGVFSFDSAMTLVGVFAKMTDERPSVGVFIIEAQMRDGAPSAIIRAIGSTPSLRGIPVVIYTSADNDEAKRACLAAGATKVFPKGPGTKGAEALADYVKSLVPKE